MSKWFPRITSDVEAQKKQKAKNELTNEPQIHYNQISLDKLSPQHLLSLQRTVGNRAVQKMIGHKRSMIQRELGYGRRNKIDDEGVAAVNRFWAHRLAKGDAKYNPPHNYAFAVEDPSIYARSDGGGHAERSVMQQYTLKHKDWTGFTIFSEMEPCDPCKTYFKEMLKGTGKTVYILYFLKYNQGKLGEYLQKLYMYHGKIKLQYVDDEMPTKAEIEEL